MSYLNNIRELKLLARYCLTTSVNSLAPLIDIYLRVALPVLMLAIGVSGSGTVLSFSFLFFFFSCYSSLPRVFLPNSSGLGAQIFVLTTRLTPGYVIVYTSDQSQGTSNLQHLFFLYYISFIFAFDSVQKLRHTLPLQSYFIQFRVVTKPSTKIYLWSGGSTEM